MRGHTLNKPTFAMNPLSNQVKSLIRRVIAQIPEAEEPHAVGGFLRDSLLGRPTNDLDITVRGDAMEVARRLAGEMGGSYVALDQPHQIARVVLQSRGRSGRIDLASLQGDREQDLARRDFTYRRHDHAPVRPSGRRVDGVHARSRSTAGGTSRTA